VFLDRDGVINRKAPEGRYVTSWAGFHFLPGALDALALLAAAGVPLIVVTNQRGIARGALTAADLADIHARMQEAVSGAGGRLDAIYHCPHEGPCRCRKPETGMFQDAAARFGLALERTAVIGDQPTDMEAARRIGALALLVGGGAAPHDGAARVASGDVAHLAPHLLGAVRWLGEQGHLAFDAGIVKATSRDADA
jgi:histidinol-phosphate phosphatase family protein